MLLHLLAIALAAAAGALARFGVGVLAARLLGERFPLGTLAVNVLGCLLAGLVVGLAARRDALSPELRLVITVGFLGSFTTFSAFGVEVMSLSRQEGAGIAAAYVALSVALSLAGVFVGEALARPA